MHVTTSMNNDRRTFLKNAAAGAVLLGARNRLGIPNLIAQEASAAKTKVIVAHDASLQSASPTESQVLALLDKAILAASIHHNVVEAWKFIGYPHIYKNRVIGLKGNCAAGRALATHTALVMAICERLQQAGVSPGNIVIWDRNAHNLEACGFKVNTDHGRVRCLASDMAGYEDHEDVWGVARVRLSKILTRECSLVLNIPILQDHKHAGVSFAMMNLCGAAENTEPFDTKPNPAVADFSCIPALRDKTSITIGDALSSLYEGGPTLHPNRISRSNSIIVGDDRVATDYAAWHLLDSQRKSAGLPTLAAAGRAPQYIHTAADTVHILGTDDPKRIVITEV
jgi:uncharacterized protein (DUF362 family)